MDTELRTRIENFSLGDGLTAAHKLMLDIKRFGVTSVGLPADFADDLSIHSTDSYDTMDDQDLMEYVADAKNVVHRQELKKQSGERGEFACLRELFAHLSRLSAETGCTFVGRIEKVHHLRKNVFLHLVDGSTPHQLQLVALDDSPAKENAMKCKRHDMVRVNGTLVPSLGKGQSHELRLENLEIIGAMPAADESYPVSKPDLSVDYLRTVPHLRIRDQRMQARMRIRSSLSFATHLFFNERGFTLVHTPLITGSDCEGAGEMFKILTSEEYRKILTAGAGAGAGAESFFGMKDPAGLTVSGQLELEPYALELGNVYTFGPTFRAEKSKTSRHLTEFWMIEPEVRGATLDDDIKLGTSYIQHCIRYVLSHHMDDLKLLSVEVPSLLNRLTALAEQKLVVLTYTDVVAEFKLEWGVDLSTEVEKQLAQTHGMVAVTQYPKSLKPFYMKLTDGCGDRRETVECMDILVPNIGEIIGGSAREDNYDILTERMREAGLDLAEYQWYTDTRKYGTAPHAGFGLGFERLVMLCTGTDNIKDVIPYPRSFKGNLSLAAHASAV